MKLYNLLYFKQGIDFGIHMIRKAVGSLKKEIPGLSQFSSLSPIPGFAKWLDHQCQQQIENPASNCLLPSEIESVRKAAGLNTAEESVLFISNMSTNRDWTRDKLLVDSLKGPVTDLCVRYLQKAKRPSGHALDAVANFHLRNGAVMWRVNWMADTSLNGMRQSLGLMVNYRYYLDELEGFSRSYLLDCKINTGVGDSKL